MAKRRRARTVGEILGAGSGPASNLRAKAATLNNIDQRVRASLPDALASHVHAVNYEQGRLTLKADSAVWCSRLRFQLPEILARLRAQSGMPVERIDTGVLRNEEKLQRRVRKAHISQAAADDLTRAAGTLGDDALGEILQRIAGRAGGRGSSD